MRVIETSSFQEMLAKRREDAPQVIVAGWFLPDGRPVGATATVCDVTPTDGQLAASIGTCLAACFKRLDELCADRPPEMRDQLIQLTLAICEGMDVVDRFRSGLVSEKALAGAPASQE